MTVGNSIALATQRVVAPVQGMHRAIADRWFSAAGHSAEPVRRVHDRVSEAVYGSVRVGGALAGKAFDAGTRQNSPVADSAQSVVNGLWGDDLGRHAPDLGIEMAVRNRHGAAVPVTDDLRDAVPNATGRPVVLIHGLMETERCWAGAEGQPGLFGSLEEHPDLTPVAIRYNSGLRISDNGETLAALLAEIHSSWPVPVESISLVGHSMGGLVIRSACLAGREAGHRWIDDVDHVVTVGTPHRGTPLEKIANVAAWMLGATRETRPLAEFLNGRSAGIKDLRFGAIAAGDWRSGDPDALLNNAGGDHPLPSGIQHHFVAGVVTGDPGHPVGASIGDLVVRASSATARDRLSPTSTAVFGRTRHATLQRNPEVVKHIMECLGGVSASTASARPVGPNHERDRVRRR